MPKTEGADRTLHPHNDENRVVRVYVGPKQRVLVAARSMSQLAALLQPALHTRRLHVMKRLLASPELH